MNTIATNTKSSRNEAAPAIVATLNLDDDNHRRVHALVQRLHGGRWPLFKCLGMRQIEGVLYEAVKWRQIGAPSFGIVTWRADGLGLSWQAAATHKAAMAALRSLR